MEGMQSNRAIGEVKQSQALALWPNGYPAVVLEGRMEYSILPV